MASFLRDTWVYILIPFVVLAVAIVLFLILDDSPTPFVYNIY